MEERWKVSKEEGVSEAPQMLAVPAGWRVDLSLAGMQILHKLYTSDV